MCGQYKLVCARVTLPVLHITGSGSRHRELEPHLITSPRIRWLILLRHVYKMRCIRDSLRMFRVTGGCEVERLGLRLRRYAIPTYSDKNPALNDGGEAFDHTLYGALAYLMANMKGGTRISSSRLRQLI